MALSPVTLSQPQCSAVHKLANFSHANKYEKTTALDREHFAVFVRIRRHMEEAIAAMLESKLFNRLGHGRRQRADYGQMAAEGNKWRQNKQRAAGSRTEKQHM